MTKRDRRAEELERLHPELRARPDELSWGPTCLQGVFEACGQAAPPARLVAQIPKVPSGDTAGFDLADRRHGWSR